MSEKMFSRYFLAKRILTLSVFERRVVFRRVMDRCLDDLVFDRPDIMIPLYSSFKYTLRDIKEFFTMGSMYRDDKTIDLDVRAYFEPIVVQLYNRPIHSHTGPVCHNPTDYLNLEAVVFELIGLEKVNDKRRITFFGLGTKYFDLLYIFYNYLAGNVLNEYNDEIFCFFEKELMPELADVVSEFSLGRDGCWIRSLCPAFRARLSYFHPCNEMFCFELFQERLIYTLARLNLSIDSNNSESEDTAASKPLKIIELPKRRGFRNNFNAILESADFLQKQYPALTVEDVCDCIQTILCLCDLYHIFFLLPLPEREESKLLKIKDAQDRIKQFEVNRSFYKSVHLLLRFQNGNPKGSWVKFWKWKTASYFAMKYEGQDPIPRPQLNFGHAQKIDSFFGCEILLGGIFHDTLKSFSAEPRNLRIVHEFNASVLNLKKGFPRPPEEMKEKSLSETFVQLTTAPSNYKDDQIADIELIKDEIDRVVEEIFGDSKVEVSDLSRPQFPSTSACVTHSVKKCGQAGALMEAMKKKGIRLDKIPDPQIGSVHAYLTGRMSTHYGDLGVDEDLYFQILREADLEVPEEITAKLFAFHEYDEFYLSIFDEMFELAYSEETPKVKLVALLEALKIRVISKGPGITYFVLKWFQKWLFKQLRRFDVFKFIGEPLNMQYMLPFLNQCLPGFQFVSGDYKASTDNLRSWVSEKICHKLFQFLGENADNEFIRSRPSFLKKLKELVIRSLTGHLIENPLKKGEFESQKNGQLMGSIVSFPFLCIANFVVCRMAMERGMNCRYNINRIPLLVNGDDCLFLSNHRGYELWLKYAGLLGLESSIGKTYFSDELATLNSQVYVKLEGVWTKIEAINLGLLYGRKRSGINKETLDITTIGTTAQQMLDNLNNQELRTNMWNRFKDLHWDILNSTRLSWFAPTWAGGLGIPGECSETDKHVVSVIRQNYAKEVVPISDCSEWFVHKHIMQEYGIGDTVNYDTITIDDPVLGFGDQSLEYNYDCTYGRLASREFFNSTHRAGFNPRKLDVFAQNLSAKNGDLKDGRIVRSCVRRNERIWKKAIKQIHTGNYELITDEEITARETKKFYPGIGLFQDNPSLYVADHFERDLSL